MTNDHVARMPDLNGRELVVLGSLAIGVLLLGLWPAPLLEIMNSSIHHLVAQMTTSKLPI